MRTSRVWILLLLAAAAACGSSTPRDPVDPGNNPPAVQTGAVSGTVLDGSNQGIGSVAVQLTRAGHSTRSTNTAANGSYSFAAVEVGSWQVAATPIAGFEADGPLTATVQVTANATATVPAMRLRPVQPPPGGTPQIVNIGDDFFSPTPLEVASGTTVRWVNGGQNAHNTTSDTGLWTSLTLQTGSHHEHTFEQAGEYHYSCTLHQNMKGTVVVQ